MSTQIENIIKKAAQLAIQVPQLAEENASLRRKVAELEKAQKSASAADLSPLRPRLNAICDQLIDMRLLEKSQKEAFVRSALANPSNLLKVAEEMAKEVRPIQIGAPDMNKVASSSVDPFEKFCMEAPQGSPR